jgi:predicted RNA-binding Zn-ribbon protein involved in translation (DUF1610 family)
MEKAINKGEPTKCYHCGYEWFYKGNNPYRRTCPHCGAVVVIRKMKRLLDDKTIKFDTLKFDLAMSEVSQQR